MGLVALVAQWIEHLTTDQKVVGSTPAGCTNCYSELCNCVLMNKHSAPNRLLQYLAKFDHAIFPCFFVMVAEITFIRPNFLEFGRLDDFSGLFNSRTQTLTEGVFHGWIQSGRFIPAVLGSLFFNLSNTVSDLFYLRLISTAFLGLGGGVLSLFVWRLFKRDNFRSLAAAVLVGVVAITTSAAPSAATWATFASQMPTFPLALLGGIVGTTRRKYFRLPWWISSTGLIVASAFCYQQFTPLAALPVCMWAAIQYVDKQQLFWRRIAFVLLQIAAALGLNAIYVFLFGDGAQDRVLVEPLQERIHWFIGTYIPRTIDIFIPNSQTSGIVSLLLLVALLVTPVVINRRNAVFPLATIISWCACAFVIFPTQLWASYRLIQPAQIALWSSTVFGFISCLKILKSRFLLHCALVVMVFALLQSDYRAFNYIARPNHYDWISTKCEIRNNLSANTFVVNVPSLSRSKVYSYDEYGAIASNFDWALTVSIRMAQLEIYEDLNMRKQLVPIKLISLDETTNLPKNTFIFIDQQMCK